MSKYIKNLTGEEIILRGIVLPPSELVLIPPNLTASWANDEIVATKIISGEVEIKPNSYTSISGYLNQISFLNDSLVDTDGAQIVRSRAFANADGFRFRGASFKGLAIAGQTTSIDYELPMERYCNGGRLIVSHVGPEDELTFQVVDKNNIMGYGANVVLDEFITKYYVPDSATLEVRLDYPARIYAYLFLRIKYKNTSETDIALKCNLFLHWKTI